MQGILRPRAARFAAGTPLSMTIDNKGRPYWEFLRDDKGPELSSQSWLVADE